MSKQKFNPSRWEEDGWECLTEDELQNYPGEFADSCTCVRGEPSGPCVICRLGSHIAELEEDKGLLDDLNRLTTYILPHYSGTGWVLGYEREDEQPYEPQFLDIRDAIAHANKEEVDE